MVTKRIGSAPSLCHFDQVPPYRKIDFIHTAYRGSREWIEINNHQNSTPDYHQVVYEWMECLKSLFYLHNETVNIWTHLLGGSLFFFAALKELGISMDILTNFIFTESNPGKH
jgi:hypothetical protein